MGTDTTDQQTRWGGAWTTATCLGLVATFSLATDLGPDVPLLRQHLSNAGQALLALLAGLACAWQGTQQPTRSAARSWYLLGASAGCWGVGQTVWTVLEAVGPDVPAPSWADPFFLVSVPIAAAALLRQFATALGWTSRLRALVDALVVTASMALVAWQWVVHDMVGQHAADLGGLVALAYPVGDVVLIAIVVLVATQGRQVGGLPLGRLGCALGGLAVADLSFSVLAEQHELLGVTIADLGWDLGYATMALAALAPTSRSSRPLAADRFHGVVAPTLATSGGLAALAIRAASAQGFDGLSLGLFATMLVGLAARLLLGHREVRTLTELLETKVEERTREARGQEERMLALIRNVSDVISVVTADGVVLFASPSIQQLLGYASGELVGTDLFLLVHPEDAPVVRSFLAGGGQATDGGARRVHARLRHRDGRWRSTETIGQPDSSVLGGAVLVTRDVTERTELEAQLRQQALHDALTGLPNRTLLGDRVGHAVATAHRTGSSIAVLFIDLDDFKGVNDTLGHSSGDELLLVVATRLVQSVRTGDTVARLGGDEFAVLMEDADEGIATTTAEAIAMALARPVRLHGTQLRLSASIGIVAASAGASAAELLRDADLAMYDAKASGKACHAVFRPELREAAIGRVRLQSELRTGVERDEFEVHYQPIVRLATGCVSGFEALVRWRRHDRLVGPNEFIPVLEDSGLIVPLGLQVLQRAVRQLETWDADHGTDDLTMAVNVSGRQLRCETLVDDVAAVLADTTVAAHRITLELTESLLLDPETTAATLHELKALGVRLAIDDFGTGFSSLSYLNRFPIDVLKIDKQFVDDLADGGRGLEVARAMVELGGVLQLATVAEGIEQAEQADHLRAAGCEFGQGYFFARPAPPADIERRHLGAYLATGAEVS